MNTSITRHLRRQVLAVAFAASWMMPANAVTIDWVTVGDSGNANDDTGYGSVGYPYQIAKYSVTIGQYADFLNAVAKADPYALYNAALSSNVQTRGISRSGTSGAYVYSLMSSSGIAPNGGVSDANRPIAWAKPRQLAKRRGFFRDAASKLATDIHI